MPDNDEPLDPLLREALGALRDTQPTQDLWPAIAPRLVMRKPKGTLLVRWPTALAAGIAIALLSATGTLLVMRRQAPSAAPSQVAAVTPATTVRPVAFTPADSTLLTAIQELESSLRRSLGPLDSTSRAGIERSLGVLDQAIADAAARRSATPDDPRAERYLTSTLRKKLNVLRTVSTLTARRS